MQKLVILTGSGISAESGIKTFRESGGLWENYDVMQVASIDGWFENQELVLQFYNDRRAQLKEAKPNPGHCGLVELEEFYDVHIITQNVDDLHEKAGSCNILHLHGELVKARSTGDDNLIYDIGYKSITLGDTCEKGYQLRPHIVWFGEAVPLFERAIQLVTEADIFAIIGTSLLVYPAAGLIDSVPASAPIYLVDPNDVDRILNRKIIFIRKKASEGVPILLNELTEFKHKT